MTYPRKTLRTEAVQTGQHRRSSVEREAERPGDAACRFECERGVVRVDDGWAVLQQHAVRESHRVVTREIHTADSAQRDEAGEQQADVAVGERDRIEERHRTYGDVVVRAKRAIDTHSPALTNAMRHVVAFDAASSVG